MTGRNLEPGQYQIGEFVFGTGTLFNVEEFDIGAYEVNVQDHQIPANDDLLFGQDTLKPMPIQITINARKNKILENMAALTQSSLASQLNFENDRRPGRFAKEWRADEIRTQWGALKPLLICRSDGRTVRVYGRPGKLAIPPLDLREQGQKIVAEFRRSDTLCYSDIEWYVQARPNEVVTITRAEDFDMGNAPCWLRFLLIGPMKHPIIQLGSLVIELDIELATGEVCEVSSYPWQRRVIRANDGLSLNSRLLRPYLDKLKFEAESGIELSWTATDTTADLEEFPFDSLPDGPLSSSEWWIDERDDGGSGSITLNNGLLQWNTSGASDHFITAVNKTPTLTRYQLVEHKLATPGEWSITRDDQPRNRIIGHSNDSRTEYSYWDFTHDYFWFGHHRNGVDQRVSEVYRIRRCLEILRLVWGSMIDGVFGINLMPQNNWVYTAEFGNGAGEKGSTFRINGHIVATHDGLNDQVTVDDSHLYTGLGMKGTAKLVTQHMPGRVAYHNFRDNAPPEVMEEVVAAQPSAVYMLWRDAWQTI